MTSPRWARKLLERAVEPSVVDDRVGDLEEVHRRRLERHGPLVAHLLTGLEAVGIAISATGARWRRGVGEIRFALRLLRRTPVMSAAAVAALAVGIGLATTGFTVLNAAYDPHLPFSGGERYADITLLDDRAPGAVDPDPERVAAWRADDTGLEVLGRYRVAAVNARWADAGVERVDLVEIEPDAMAALGFAAATGRTLSAADARPGAPAVVVLGSGLWRRRFGADPGVVGRTLDVAGARRQVVGVLGPEAVAPTDADLWTPLAAGASDGVRLFGILKAGADPDGVARRLEARAPAGSTPAPLRIDVRRPGAAGEGRASGALAVALLLGLLAVLAGNVGSLVAARTAARAPELSIRSALGASRARLVGQLVTEVGVLVAAATVLGVAGARWVIAAFVASEGDELPVWMDLGLDPAVAVFIVVAALAVTLVAGVWPALAATARDGPGGLRGQAAPGRGHGPLIVVQVAVAVAVLGCAAMVHRGWTGGLAARNPDLPVDRLVVADLTLPTPDPWPPGALLRSLAEYPGVEAATLSTHVPGTDAPRGPVAVEGASTNPVVAARIGVVPGYFDTVGAPPATGRTFVAEDLDPGAPPVVIVDRGFVARHLRGGNALGHRIRLPDDDVGFDDPGPWREIVGVVADLGVAGADTAATGAVYRPLPATGGVHLLLRIEHGDDPRPWGPTLRAGLYDVDPALGVESVRVLGEALDARRRVYRWMGSVITGVGALVLGLALLATYALLSFEVTGRTREVGVRVALGGTRARVLGPILTRTVRRLALGLVLGTALGALLLALVRATLVMRFPATGPGTFALLAAVVAGAGTLAAWLPARRALAVDPMEALRAD